MERFMTNLKLSILLGFILLLTGCEDDLANFSSGNVLYTTPGGKINTLDPALCADLTSANMVGALYDTLVEYNYTERPYKLQPSMLAEMPEISEDMKHYKFKLRDDLFFQPDKCFGLTMDGNPKKRKIIAKDVEFSFLRIGDARLHSSGYWLIRGKISGIGEFRKKSAALKEEDFSIYDTGCSGIEVIDDLNFFIHLDKPDPRFLYGLAMQYMSVVPREAVKYYKADFSEHPVGSGPFKLDYWERNYKIEFTRNPDFRKEFFADAEKKEDRFKKLPLLDRVVCYQINEAITSWLLFLQGNLDLSAVDKDSFEAIITDDLQLIPALRKRGIEMMRIPKFQIHYIGFCFTDPLLAENHNLRKAISLAYDVRKRVKIWNNQIFPANGPIPSGVAGHNADFKNPYAEFNLELAEEYMKMAGFPDGIDPKTGKTLELTFDIGGTAPTHRQIAELFVEDMEKIGIKIIPSLNNWPRFLQKSAKGEVQLYSVSWIGDYPDAENFLQLFYGPNSGSCNRSYYKDEAFDKMFDAIKTMPDTPERTAKYTKMAEYLTEQCPWIFSHYPISYRLRHSWVGNYVPHDFCFSRWKYLAIDDKKRIQSKRNFKPMKLEDLRKK